jgi:hypothetical protein
MDMGFSLRPLSQYKSSTVATQQAAQAAVAATNRCKGPVGYIFAAFGR